MTGDKTVMLIKHRKVRCRRIYPAMIGVRGRFTRQAKCKVGTPLPCLPVCYSHLLNFAELMYNGIAESCAATETAIIAGILMS